MIYFYVKTPTLKQWKRWLRWLTYMMEHGTRFGNIILLDHDLKALKLGVEEIILLKTDDESMRVHEAGIKLFSADNNQSLAVAREIIESRGFLSSYDTWINIDNPP